MSVMNEERSSKKIVNPSSSKKLAQQKRYWWIAHPSSSCERDGQILCCGDDTYDQLGDGKGLKVDLTKKKKTTTYLPVQSAVPIVRF